VEAPVECDTTSQVGYVVAAEGNLALAGFDVTVTCDTAAGYGGTAVPSPCEMSGQNYVLSGCALKCTAPSDDGYVFTEVYPVRSSCFSTSPLDRAGDADFDACAAVSNLEDGSACLGVPRDDSSGSACTYRAFEVTATCAPGYEASGSGPVVQPCAQDGGNYVVSGCEPIVCERPAADIDGYALVETNLDLSAGDFDVAVTCSTTPSAEYPGGFMGEPVVTPCTQSGPYVVDGCVEAPVECATTSQVGYVVAAEGNLALAGFDVTVTCDTAAGYEGTAVPSPCEMSGQNYVLSGCTLPPPPEEEGGSAGVVIGIILGIVAVAVIGVFGVKAMKGKGGAETTGARPSMLSPSAAAYQTDDVDPEDTSTRPGRKLSF